MIPPRQFVLPLVAALSFAVAPSVSPQVMTKPNPGEFPLSAWQEQKEITQIPWTVIVDKPTIRFDLRQELRISGEIRSEKHYQHEFTLFVRAMERGNAVSDVFSVPVGRPTGRGGVVPTTTSRYFFTGAIVRSGKYRLELALLDRTTNQYNVRFENVTVGDNENPVERTFEAFDKFDFPGPLGQRGRRGLEEQARASLQDAMSGRVGVLNGVPSPVILNGSSAVNTPDRPSFVIGKSLTTHVSVITILNPPEQAVSNTRLLGVFRANLLNFLSVVTRLDAPNGTAKLTGVDLLDHTRVLDKVDLKNVTPERMDPVLKKDTRTVSLDSLAKKGDQGVFLRDVLRERLTEAANDSSGARHAIIVVSAALALPDGSRLTIPRTRDCHCQVFYLKFALVPNETDHIPDILREYKPQVFEPLTWQEFREDFGKIYGQLLR